MIGEEKYLVVVVILNQIHSFVWSLTGVCFHYVHSIVYIRINFEFSCYYQNLRKNRRIVLLLISTFY